MNPPSSLAIVDHLIRFGVPVVVIGGHAVNIHGYARATEDVDIIFCRTQTSERQLAEALVSVNAYWIGNEINPATGIEVIHPVTAGYVREHRLMMLGTDLGFLDIFDFIPSMPEEPLDALFETSIEREGRRFANLHWLRRMKLAADRPQDRLDLENLPEA